VGIVAGSALRFVKGVMFTLSGFFSDVGVTAQAEGRGVSFQHPSAWDGQVHFVAIGASGEAASLATRHRFPLAHLPAAMRAGVPLVSGDRLVALQANGVLLRHRQLLPRHDVAFSGDDMEAARSVTGFATLQMGRQLGIQHPLAVGQGCPDAGDFVVTLHANLAADITGVPSPQRRRNFLLRHHHRRQRQRHQSCR
jgi:hypothetical protein